MGGGGTQTATETSSLNNKQLDAAVSTIGTKLNQQLDSGLKVYDQSLYPGMSGETRAGAHALANNPLNSIYSGTMGDTMSEFGAIASGQRMGENNAAWDAARDRVIGDTNSAFNASGRFAGGANQAAVSEGLGRVELARMQGDEARQMAAATMYPQLYQASALPAQMQLAGGQILDADMLASRQGEADLFDRTQNNAWNTLARGTSILAGTAPSAGTINSTTTPTAPWWQQALGYVAGNAGRAVNGGF